MKKNVLDCVELSDDEEWGFSFSGAYCKSVFI